MCRTCTHVCEYPAKDKYFKFYGILKREKHANDI